MDDILNTLDHLVDLQNTKDMVRTLINRIKVQKRQSENSQMTPGHYLFVGNPGTGTTTVYLSSTHVGFRSLANSNTR